MSDLANTLSTETGVSGEIGTEGQGDGQAGSRLHLPGAGQVGRRRRRRGRRCVTGRRRGASGASGAQKPGAGG